MTTKTPAIEWYDISKDMAAYPEAWCYVVVGGRNTGKTYGTLTHFLDQDWKLVFCKRTNDDIDTLTAGNKLGQEAAEYDLDISPYADINADRGTEVKAYKVKTGLGAFYNAEDGKAKGSPVGYLASLHRVAKIKGFGGLQICKAVVFDEFIPQPWERVDRKEGDQLMDLYKTVARAKAIKYGEELKLILLANAVSVWNPTCDTLEIVDVIADMAARKQETFYDEERRIFVRILKTPDTIIEKEKQTGIYKTMKNTAWGRMAFGNEFGYNDFSQIRHMALKNFRPVVGVVNKNKTWYIYNNEETFYMCASKASGVKIYDLNLESDQKTFYYDHVIDLQMATMERRMWYDNYTMYDMITCYKKRFNI